MAYKMSHPAGGEIEVSADAVTLYESQGWETSPNAKPPAAESPADKPARK